MSHIILDTSVLVLDSRFRSATLRAVLKSAQELHDQVLIPSVVRDELVNKFREHVEETSDALRRVEGRLSSLLDEPAPAREVNVDQQVARYRSWLQATLKENEVDEIEYPNSGHREVVARALQSRKPFDGNGQRGYRDAVVWETVLSELRLHGEEVFFVSKNISDFADANDTKRLHPDLISDLKSLQCGRARLEFFSGLEDLLERAITPRQGVIPEIKAQIDEGRLGKLQLQTWLLNVLPEKVNQTAIEWVDRHQSRRQNDWVIGRLEELGRPHLSSTSSLSEHSILIVLLLQFKAEVVLRQRELDFDISEDDGSEGPCAFLATVGVEVELGTLSVLAVTGERVIGLSQRP